MCPEGVWGPSSRNKSVDDVWGLRPYTLFTLLLHNLGCQTPLPDTIFAQHDILYFSHCIRGMDYYNSNPWIDRSFLSHSSATWPPCKTAARIGITWAMYLIHLHKGMALTGVAMLSRGVVGLRARDSLKT